MKELTCVVIGGGYAGIHAARSIQKTLTQEATGRQLRLILMDKNPYHLRKVLLFQATARNKDITIPLKQLFPEGVEIVQATVTRIGQEDKKLYFEDVEGLKHVMNYDIAVVAAGSVVREPDPQRGGLALTGLDVARKIREAWRANLKKASMETSAEEQQRLMTIAVGGAGISGIETSAELAHFVREDARQLGLDPREVRIILFNSSERLFQEGPAKTGRKLEHALRKRGVTVIHQCKVLQERDGLLTLSSGATVPVGLLIWTLGLMPNPMLRSMGLPVNSEGHVIVDESYRVNGAKDIYSIGDCAHIMDPFTGKVDGKTCKEAAAQAMRLGKIILSDLAGRPAPVHKEFMDLFCFGLGPKQGMAWIRMRGIDIYLTGMLGWRMRKFTWDIASLL